MLDTDSHSLSADYLVASRDFALSRGVSAETLIEGSGVSLGLLLNPPARVSHDSLQRIHENMMNALGSFYETAVAYGRFMEVSTHGVLGMAIQSTGTLYDASRLMVQYIKTRTSVQFAEVITGDDFYRLRFSHDPSVRLRSASCVTILFEVAILVSFDAIIKKLLSRQTLKGFTVLNMTVAAPEKQPEYLAHLNSDVCFDQPRMELCVPSSWMNLPFGQADEALGQAATELCESELRALQPKDIVARLLETIRNIEGQKPSLEDMAADMYMSVSTLQRRLKEQDVTFQQLKSEARLLQAKELLVNSSLALDEVASRLGFSDSSNFSKSFKSWTGLTPIAFRNTNAAHEK